MADVPKYFTPNARVKTFEAIVEKERDCAIRSKKRLQQLVAAGHDPTKQTWTRIGYHTSFRSLPNLPELTEEIANQVDVSEYTAAVRAIPQPICSSSTGTLHHLAYRRHRPLVPASLEATSREPTPAQGGPHTRLRLIQEVYGDAGIPDYARKFTTPPTSDQAFGISRKFRRRKPGGGFFGE